ncbi:MAG: cytochrome c [Deltaproteobacteria bacterium]|nr:cytochrome c [Deltaproteobacteria bacterium]
MKTQNHAPECFYRGSKLLTLSLALFLFINWHGSGFAAESKKGVINIKRGKEIYHERCAACHGIDGNPILPASPNFAKGERMEKPDKELLNTIKHGKNLMPPWKDVLTEEEIKDALTFVRLVAGEKAFDEKCAKCHSSSIPKLRADVPDTKTLKNSQGQLDICRGCEIEKEMTNEELIEVIKYMRTLGK